MLEKDIVAAIKRYLATLGEDVFFWKEHGGPYGVSGVPDIICCYKGRFLGLEAKLPGGKLTALQERGAGENQSRGRHRPEGGERGRCQGRHCTGRSGDEGGRKAMRFGRKQRRPDRPLIFVCSPYRGDTETNVQNARRYCRLVVEQGGIPFCAAPAVHAVF